MPDIDHEPREKRPTWRIWWFAWLIIIVLWALTIYRADTIDWELALLGIATGALLAAWAITITDDKPSSLLRRQRRD